MFQSGWFVVGLLTRTLGPLAGAFKLQPLPPAYFGWLAAILLGYALLTALVKRVYVRKFGWN